MLSAVIACGLAAVIGLLLAGGDSGNSSPKQWSGFVRPPGAPVPAFSLRDQDGVTVRPPSEVAVYTFIYSTCEDTCPLQVQQIRGALDRLGRDVPVIGVSVDPARDTAARARRFLLEQHMTGRMRFALGAASELEPLWRAFGIRPQKGSLDHSAYVVLADASQRQRIGFPVGALTIDGLAADLERLREEG